MMWKAKDKIKAGDEDTLRQWDALLGDYVGRCWYWEVSAQLASICNKIALVGCAVLGNLAVLAT